MNRNQKINTNTFVLLALALVISSAGRSQSIRETRTISFNEIAVEVVIDKPVTDTVDVLLAFHGTVFYNDKIRAAALTTLEKVKSITHRSGMLIISVAYPEQGLLMGDNIREAEAALLWVQQKAGSELGVSIRKIFLVGHSQGGYIVTRLNTLYATDGVVANGPGPLDLALRCRLEENKKAPGTITCRYLKDNYGPVDENPGAYRDRSLLAFTGNFKSDILFVQGLNDGAIQMAGWSAFKQKLSDCSSCKAIQFLELAGYGHTALFDSPEAIKAFNDFISR